MSASLPLKWRYYTATPSKPYLSNTCSLHWMGEFRSHQLMVYFANWQRGPLKDLEPSKVGCFQLVFLAHWPQEQHHSLAQKVPHGLKTEAAAGVMNCLAARLSSRGSCKSIRSVVTYRFCSCHEECCLCCTAVGVRAAEMLPGRDGCVVT